MYIAISAMNTAAVYIAILYIGPTAVYITTNKKEIIKNISI